MKFPKLFLQLATVAAALLAGFFLTPAGRAQPEPEITDSRFLFIFDTSADMKKRLPAVQTELIQLLSTSLGSQLRGGDSIGVWTFDKDLRTGQFPLLHWSPDDAVTIAASINKLVGKQRYANGTSFNALKPLLNQVIQSSERLTVLIFCDGEDEINWTPYDPGINEVFQQRLAEEKKSRQPFVLVLRTQFGQYAGCTVNFPPGMVSFPEFPPPPVLEPVSPPPPAPVAAPPPIGPPLIIVGTNVEAKWPLPPAPPLPTNPAPVMPTNVVPAAPANVVAPTNTVAHSSETPGPDRKGELAIGAALLVAAAALVALAIFNRRRPDRSSLITRSMRKD